MKKKIVIMAAVVLFIGASVIPSISADIGEINTFSTMLKGYIYVDDDFNESTPGWNVTHFDKIQNGIDASIDFDTVFVYNGTYNENIKIGSLVFEKKITLTGEDRDNTIILGATGGDAVITIPSRDAEVNGFTIDGNSCALEGIRVSELKQDITLTNNRIIDCSKGILLMVTTKRIEISDNIISGSDFVGIELQESDSNDIYNNEVTGNKVGIKLSIASTQNSIYNNTVTSNDMEGIIIEGVLTTDNILTGNTITNNRDGIKLSSSSKNTLENNNIQNNDMEGLLLEFSNNNIIEKNNFIENQRHASFKFSRRNTWDENYWDSWIGLKINMSIFQKFPKVIWGFPRINLDWHPALDPYAI